MVGGGGKDYCSITLWSLYLEYDMGMVVQHFGIEATFSALRTLVIICFGPEKDQQAQTHVLHAEQSFDCDRLYLVCGN